jgi:hypothetical protein
MKKLIASIAVAGLAACSGSATPSSSSNAVLDGTIKGASSLRASIPGTSLKSTTDAAGNFALVNVPIRTTALLITGNGVNVTLPIAALASGENRHMAISVSGNSAWEQHELESDDLAGVVSAIVAPNLTVAGKTITTSAATLFFQHGAAVTLDAVAVGVVVEVEGAPQADGSILARKITIEGADDGSGQPGDDGQSGRQPRLEGTLTGISGTTLTVNGVSVTTSATTVFEAADETHITLADLAVGDRVEVRGDPQADGSFAASKVEVDATADAAEDVHLTGAVTAVDVVAGSLTIGTTTVLVTADTHLDGVASLVAILAGDIVDVEATVAADGSLIAKEIRAASALLPPLLVEVRGPVSAVDATAGMLTVAGKTFTVTADTRLDHNGQPFTFASLTVGQNVDVLGALQASGELTASRIQLRN